MERWSDYGIGEPSDGNGITARGTGHVVREGANFEIRYEIRAICGPTDIPTVTVSISGGASNWDVIGSWTGTRNSAAHNTSGGTKPDWKNWVSVGGANFTYTIPWTLSGTTTDDDCHGGETTGPTVSIQVNDPGQVPSLIRSHDFQLSKQDDDRSLDYAC